MFCVYFWIHKLELEFKKKRGLKVFKQVQIWIFSMSLKLLKAWFTGVGVMKKYMAWVTLNKISLYD